MNSRVEKALDSDALAQKAAKLIVERSRQVLSQNDIFTIALSGGSTPKRLYELLADPNQEFSTQLSWDRIHFFWTDERHVSPEHADSNFRMVHEAMLSHVPVPSRNIHRILSENENAEEVAANYEDQLKRFFYLPAGNQSLVQQLRDVGQISESEAETDMFRNVILEASGAQSEIEVPRFDLVLLGLGNDGHTASLFPGSEVLAERNRLVSAPWVEKLNSYRFTMTLTILNGASSVVFLVSGSEKAEILHSVLEGKRDTYPAQAINPANGQLLWLVDSAAASKLESA